MAFMKQEEIPSFVWYLQFKVSPSRKRSKDHGV